MIQRACGSQELGDVGGCVAVTDEVLGERFLFVRDCDNFRDGEERRLQDFVTTVEPTDNLLIHGYASEEGASDYNENLSCWKAHKASSVLLHEGIPVTQITALYKHGARLVQDPKDAVWSLKNNHYHYQKIQPKHQKIQPKHQMKKEH
ncbi:MAG: hypothetical protein HRO68_09815 [Nitrosopumilus sp.]|nr:hypothetical protein [Nitrosopumilus sp.]